MAELTFGCCLTAAIIAWMQKGSGDSDTPSRSRNPSLARPRSRITAVMSTSTAEVSWALTATVSSSPTLIDWTTPATGEGTSVSTLSVETSNRGSSTSTRSPSRLSQRVMVPSVIDSPSSGMRTANVPPPSPAGAACSGCSLAASAGSASAAAAPWGSSSAASPPVSAPGRSPASSLAAGAWPSSASAASISASSVPTGTVSSSWTLIDVCTPATGEGTSVSTLSVESSYRCSSTTTRSPSRFSQRVMVPSVIDSPSSGILIGLAIVAPSPCRRLHAVLPAVSPPSALVQRASRQRQVRLADRLGKGRVGVDELGDLRRQRLPVVDQHRLGDQLGHPRADQVDAEHRAVLGRDQLHHSALPVHHAPGHAVEGEAVR